MIGYGWSALSSTGSDQSQVNEVQAHDDHATLLLETQFPAIRQAETSLRAVVEVDRVLHQALVAERAALIESDLVDMTAIQSSHGDAIAQAEALMMQASGGFVAQKVQSSYDAWQRSFTSWQDKSGSVIRGASSSLRVEGA